jgi:hypothetical protein
MVVFELMDTDQETANNVLSLYGFIATNRLSNARTAKTLSFAKEQEAMPVRCFVCEC